MGQTQRFLTLLFITLLFVGGVAAGIWNGAERTNWIKEQRTVCTLMGCGPRASLAWLDLPRSTESLRFCLDDECVRVIDPDTHESGISVRTFGFRDLRRGSPVAASLELFDERGREILRRATVIRVRTWYPNGKGCPGACPSASAKFRDGRLEEWDADDRTPF